jgi:OOP family OmpA-OmpF porin
MLRALVLVVGLAAASSASAQRAVSDDLSSQDSGWQFGVAIGQSGLHIDSDDLDASGSEDAFGAKLFGAYRFNRNFAAELGWIYGGTFEDSEDGLSVSIKPRFLTGTVVGTVPFTDSFAGFAKAGITRWDATLSASDGQVSESVSGNGTEFLWGVGLLWSTGSVDWRLEFEGTEIEQEIVEDISAEFRYTLLSLGIVWDF